jgi:aminoglycoside 3-N-acetyltransferase I
MSQSAFTVRRLGPADSADLLRLNVMFGAAFSDEPTYAQPLTESYVQELLGKDSIHALIATADDEVIGGLVAYEFDKFERMQREIYIYDLAVAEAYRRRGVATALIEALQKIAAQRGAWVIFVQADYGDDPAIALYEKLGSREEVLHFDIPVPKAEGNA